MGGILMINNKFIMIGIVWFFSLISFGRTWRKSAHPDYQVLVLRWLIVLFAISFSFWGTQAEDLLDQYFNHYPVALFVKLVTLVTVVYLFHEMLKIIHKTPSPLKFLDYLAFIVYPFAMITFFLFVTTHFMSREQLRYLIIGIRDLIILIYMLSHFLSRTWLIWKIETIQVTKLKGLLIFICFVCFCITAVGSILATLFAFINLDYALFASTFLDPIVYLGATFFVLQLLPDRFLMILFIIARWYTYAKIRRIESYIVDDTLNSIPLSKLLDYSFLEIAIYRSIIRILDRVVLLEDTDPKYDVAQKIQRITSNNLPYPELVQNMTKIQI
jgi:hypothetical protein